MRFTAAFVSSIALVLGVTAAPVDDKYERPVATFSAWNTECGLNSGHTFGMTLVDRAWSGLCFPLPDHVRGLELTELAEGCAITAFESPVCDDYPYNGSKRDRAGCLWSGNREFRSYKLTCDK